MVHISRKRVYYKDTDAGGVVYYTRYGEFLEIARSEMLRDLGLSAKEALYRYHLILPVVELHLYYKKPAAYDALLSIKTKIVKVSPVRIFFEYEILDEEEGLCCRASTVNCGVGVDDLKPKRFPVEFQALLEKAVEGPTPVA